MGLERHQPDPGEEIRRQAQHIREFLELTVTREVTEEEAQQDIEHLLKLLYKSDYPAKIGKLLIESVGPDNFVPHGDHKHWVIRQEGKLREGPLAAVSQIEPHSNQNPQKHEHPINCLETVIALGPGLIAVTSDTKDGQVECHRVFTLVPYSVPAGKFHSDYNSGSDKVTYIVIRRVLK